MIQEKKHINMPWSHEEDARIIIALHEDKHRTLELPGRTSNQIIRRIPSAMLRYKQGELKRYINTTENKSQCEVVEQNLREPIPFFERRESQIVKLNERAEKLLAKIETINPLSEEFYKTVNEYNVIEIKLQSFYLQ